MIYSLLHIVTIIPNQEKTMSSMIKRNQLFKQILNYYAIQTCLPNSWYLFWLSKLLRESVEISAVWYTNLNGIVYLRNGDEMKKWLHKYKQYVELRWQPFQNFLCPLTAVLLEDGSLFQVKGFMTIKARQNWSEWHHSGNWEQSVNFFKFDRNVPSPCHSVGLWRKRSRVKAWTHRLHLYHTMSAEDVANGRNIDDQQIDLPKERQLTEPLI